MEETEIERLQRKQAASRIVKAPAELEADTAELVDVDEGQGDDELEADTDDEVGA